MTGDGHCIRDNVSVKMLNRHVNTISRWHTTVRHFDERRVNDTRVHYALRSTREPRTRCVSTRCVFATRPYSTVANSRLNASRDAWKANIAWFDKLFVVETRLGKYCLHFFSRDRVRLSIFRGINLPNLVYTVYIVYISIAFNFRSSLPSLYDYEIFV